MKLDDRNNVRNDIYKKDALSRCFIKLLSPRKNTNGMIKMTLKNEPFLIKSKKSSDSILFIKNLIGNSL